MSIAENVDPFQADLPIGTVVRAVDALDWKVGQRACDIRPRLYDKTAKVNRLLDSGSQISVTKKRPEDKIDNSFRLIAVNGSKITTYGVRDIEVKIGRKEYKIPAVICDVPQEILGMDFINKFKLNFEWDDFDQSELYLVDRKAQIRAPLQVVTVPIDTPRVSYLDNETLAQCRGVAPTPAKLGPKPRGGAYTSQITSTRGPCPVTSRIANTVQDQVQIS